ncbi:hypothetical protein ACFQ3H_13175 [Paralysiella testudinis]|uniref:hypothetical protein n=1 Tax=Paralysiella testudinis TaxID=2809020 RepID=UPI0036358EF9
MKMMIVPLSKDGLEKLNFNCYTSEDVYQLTLTDIEIDTLFAIGFFQHINQALNIYIDDFEDTEIIDYRKLLIMKNIVGDYLRKHDEFHHIYQSIYKLICLALEKETGLFFFF